LRELRQINSDTYLANNRRLPRSFSDSGYFDNSGVFMLSEWLKVAVSTSVPGSKRILILQLGAFPDCAPPVTDEVKKWYYQTYSPINAMLTVRSEGQIVRDTAIGEDLQKLLNADGFQTTWMLVRYTSPAVSEMCDGMACPSDPPLSWHLTPQEQRCINTAWTSVQPNLATEVKSFLKPPLGSSPPTCAPLPDLPPGMFERQCGTRTLVLPARLGKK
jgi:hypothetical protein